MHGCNKNRREKKKRTAIHKLNFIFIVTNKLMIIANDYHCSQSTIIRLFGWAFLLISLATLMLLKYFDMKIYDCTWIYAMLKVYWKWNQNRPFYIRSWNRNFFVATWIKPNELTSALLISSLLTIFDSKSNQVLQHTHTYRTLLLIDLFVWHLIQ